MLVQCYGTEDRPAEREIPPSTEIFPFIKFSGRDVIDLTVVEKANTEKQDSPLPDSDSDSESAHPTTKDSSPYLHNQEDNKSIPKSHNLREKSSERHRKQWVASTRNHSDQTESKSRTQREKDQPKVKKKNEEYFFFLFAVCEAQSI